MVTAENYALNNECASNNEVLRISSYHSVICGERQGDVAHGNTRSQAQLGKHRTCKCTSIFGLPASVSGFLFVRMWVMHMNRMLCCFGDKRCKMVGHVPRINCSAMIAVFMYTLETSNCTLPVYREHGSVVKCIQVSRERWSAILIGPPPDRPLQKYMVPPLQ